MPTSFRLDPSLVARLRAIAVSEGVPLSEVLRRAAELYVDRNNETLAVRLSDVVGVVQSTGGRARRSGETYKRLIKERK